MVFGGSGVLRWFYERHGVPYVDPFGRVRPPERRLRCVRAAADRSGRGTNVVVCELRTGLRPGVIQDTSERGVATTLRARRPHATGGPGRN
ncbi:hypothetical protein GCM10023094_19430 [Rhodococcus olei]|uniref:Uncharacterized protein n=1 Tax=Rhodococcus olei TaxID=2161675 RepID=A0ABP8P0M5_9NOCA